VPEALRAAGVEIRVHDELFPQGTQDVDWLREAGANRWVVITRDDRIRYNQLEKQAVIAARLRFFSITSSSLTGDEAASLILWTRCRACAGNIRSVDSSRRFHAVQM
jgi:hypothetical protein